MRTALIPILGLVLLQSCSWYRNLERSLVDDDEKQAKKNRPVSREQYDQLLVKYEELSKKYQHLKEGKGPEKSALVEELQRTSGENFSTTPGGADTVDAFGGAGPQAVTSSTPLSVPADVESQLTLFKRGVSLKGSNPGEATKIFQGLEAEGIEPVKVRSKLQIGELLFGKGQFDLALQVFEDIINKHSNSGVTIDALRYASLCSEKLGLSNKKEQYTSMLRDVFEAQ